MGDFGYIIGYVMFFLFFLGVIIGQLAGYHQRKNEEPKDMRKLVDGWKKHKLDYKL